MKMQHLEMLLHARSVVARLGVGKRQNSGDKHEQYIHFQHIIKYYKLHTMFHCLERTPSNEISAAEIRKSEICIQSTALEMMAGAPTLEK